MSASDDGYRDQPRGGPRVRTDIVDVYIFRRAAPGSEQIELLQLLRASEPLGGTWQPIMGHVEAGETAVAAAVREMREEVGLAATDAAVVELWALEQVHPFYLAALDCIVLSPRFAAEVRPDWSPTLNREHTSHRWTTRADDFMWPGQKRVIEEIGHEIVRAESLARERLRIIT